MNTLDETVAHPAALKLVLGLGALFVLVLLGIRLADLAALAQAVSDRVPFVQVNPGIQGTTWLVLAMAIAPLALLLPRAWRKAAWLALLLASLLAAAISGNSSTPGGSGLAHTPVAHWLQSQGYARCAAGDQVHHGLHADTVAEGWAQPGNCPASFAAPEQAR